MRTCNIVVKKGKDMADEEKKSLMEEFREFIDKGNAMDMAVGVIIGGAFTAIVTALTTDIINPIITLLTGGVAGPDGVTVGGLIIPGTSIDIGSFIGAIINFLIIAIIVFLMVKSLNHAKDAAAKLAKRGKEEEEAEPEMNPPACPFCLEEVKEGATRCPHCAGAFDEPAKATPAE